LVDKSARAGALASAALHAAAVGALLSHEPARTALLAAAPIMVDWIAPPAAEPQPPVPAPRPRAAPARAVQAPPTEAPVLATPVQAPAPAEPQSALEKHRAASAPEAAPPRATEPAPSEAVALVAPIFDAAYLENAPPSYPYLSRRTGEQGRVVLRVQVSAAGTAEEVEVRSSSGHSRLDQAAREAVRRWKFVPARRGGTPVPAAVLVPVSFRLEG
jgi:protein TonB